MQTNGEIIFGTNVSANYQLEVNAEQIDQRCTKNCGWTLKEAWHYLASFHTTTKHIKL